MLLIDSIIVVFSGIIAVLLQRNSYVSITNLFSIAGTFLCYLIAYLIGFRIMRTYLGVIRYSSFVDLYRVALANLIGIGIIFVVRHLTPIDKVLFPVSWEVLLISFFLSTKLMWGMRIIVKYIHDIYFISSSARKVFIYGIKEGGIALAKSIHSQESHFIIAGFVSDDKSDCEHILMGTKIYLNDENLVARMQKKGATVLMVSPNNSDSLRDNQKMIDSLIEAGIKIMVYSSQVWDGKSDNSPNSTQRDRHRRPSATQSDRGRPRCY